MQVAFRDLDKSRAMIFKHRDMLCCNVGDAVIEVVADLLTPNLFYPKGGLGIGTTILMGYTIDIRPDDVVTLLNPQA